MNPHILVFCMWELRIRDTANVIAPLLASPCLLVCSNIRILSRRSCTLHRSQTTVSQLEHRSHNRSKQRCQSEDYRAQTSSAAASRSKTSPSLFNTSIRLPSMSSVRATPSAASSRKQQVACEPGFRYLLLHVAVDDHAHPSQTSSERRRRLSVRPTLRASTQFRRSRFQTSLRGRR